MIRSVYRKIHPQTGIIYVLINTDEKWVDYQVGFTAKDGTIPIAFYPHKDSEVKEFVEMGFVKMGKDFDYFNYVVTHRQEKDQITIVCVPENMMIKEFKPYKYRLQKSISMKREIKFRGKCVSDSRYAGQWVEGGYVPPCEESTSQKEGLIVVYLGGNTSCTYHVDPDTVGQFTGLKDKNGVEIYEGDILDVTVFDCFDNDRQYKVRVEWIGTEFMGFLDEDTAWNLYWLLQQDDEAEVIGNIYDNEHDKK